MVRQLVERIRQKDQRAMTELYQRYVEELSSVCYRYVPQENDAKDVLQNSFVKIFTSVESLEYQGEASFRGWMKKVVANEALSYLKNRRKLLFIEHEAVNLQAEFEEEPEPERISPDDLHQLIRELPNGYRTVLNLFVFEGYSHRQIAELLGISEATSASQLFYAKRLLAKRIKEITDKQR
ncbi:MAG: RNA polymerase sigma factor [Prevotella sp.]|nr:RNA polymerase sigma factor [Prevotella sp.]